MSSFSHLARSFKPTTPGEKESTLAPAKTLKDVGGTGFAGRMCMYRAMSGVTYGTDDPLRILNSMRPLIEFFEVPYDEDIWGLVMAYVLGLTFHKCLNTRVEFDKVLGEAGEEGTFFISIIATEHGTSGHAIWAKKEANKSIVFHDNEDPGDGGVGKGTIRPKFGDNYRFVIFKKAATAPTNAIQLHTRIDCIPPKLLRLLIKIHNMYANVAFNENSMATIDGQKVKAYDKAEKLEAFETLKSKIASKMYQEPQYSELLHRELETFWKYEKAQ